MRGKTTPDDTQRRDTGHKGPLDQEDAEFRLKHLDLTLMGHPSELSHSQIHIQ